MCKQLQDSLGFISGAISVKAVFCWSVCIYIYIYNWIEKKNHLLYLKISFILDMFYLWKLHILITGIKIKKNGGDDFHCALTFIVLIKYIQWVVTVDI